MSRRMRPHSRAPRTAFRRAVVASVALHVIVAGPVLVLLRDAAPRRAEPPIDTRAPADIRMSFAAVPVEPVEIAPVSPPPTPAVPSAPAEQPGTAQATPATHPPAPEVATPPAAGP